MTNNLFIDTQTPWAGAHLNATCFSPGATVQIIDGGSGDSSPSSGWNTTYGMWYYQASGGADSGWTNNNNWSWTVPTPGYGSQGNYAAYESIRDNAFNQSAAAGYGFSVDNTAPSGGWVSPSATYTSSTTVNLSFAAYAGGCKGIGNVAITNDQKNWWYAGSSIGSFSNWNFTSGYGGNANQGAHTITVAFNEAGTGNWTYYSTSVTYDTVGPTGTTTLSIGSASYTNSAFTINWSISDPTSGLANAATYVWTKPSTDGVGNCTGTTSGATAISYAASGSASSGFSNGTCAEYQTQANDNAGNFGATAMTQWVMFDNAAPSFGSFSAPTGLVQQHTLTYGFAWSASDNASGIISYNLQAQTAPVVSGACSGTWTNSGSVVNQAGASYSLSTPTNGTCYRLGVSPIDRAANGGSSYTYSAAILIDTNPPPPPSTPILAPGSDTGSSNTDGLTYIANGLVFTGTAEANSVVTIYNGASALGSATATGGGSYSVTTSVALTGGAYSITATAADAAGNSGSASSGYAVVIHLTCPN